MGHALSLCRDPRALARPHRLGDLEGMVVMLSCIFGGTAAGLSTAAICYQLKIDANPSEVISLGTSAAICALTFQAGVLWRRWQLRRHNRLLAGKVTHVNDDGFGVTVLIRADDHIHRIDLGNIGAASAIWVEGREVGVWQGRHGLSDDVTVVAYPLPVGSISSLRDDEGREVIRLEAERDAAADYLGQAYATGMVSREAIEIALERLGRAQSSQEVSRALSAALDHRQQLDAGAQGELSGAAANPFLQIASRLRSRR